MGLLTNSMPSSVLKLMLSSSCLWCFHFRASLQPLFMFKRSSWLAVVWPWCFLNLFLCISETRPGPSFENVSGFLPACFSTDFNKILHFPPGVVIFLGCLSIPGSSALQKHFFLYLTTKMIRGHVLAYTTAWGKRIKISDTKFRCFFHTKRGTSKLKSHFFILTLILFFYIPSNVVNFILYKTIKCLLLYLLFFVVDLIC